MLTKSGQFSAASEGLSLFEVLLMQFFNDLGPASSLATEKDNFLEEMTDDMRDPQDDGRNVCVWVICLHICLCTMYVFGAQGGQERA